MKEDKFLSRLLLLTLSIVLAAPSTFAFQQCCGDPMAQCGDSGPGQGPSPIIIDLSGNGFYLTNAEDGVLFDFFGTGMPMRIGWIASEAANGFLALDRNGNGRIDNAGELFGNVTLQPASDSPNGFLALAEFDKPANGGNGDGVIDKEDAVYRQLVIWVDSNHDGISQPEEMHSLKNQGIQSIDLKYKELARRDEFGNIFRYRAKVNGDSDKGPSAVGRWAYDVFFTTK